MKQIYANLDVVRGLFGAPKSFMKQQFKKRLWAFMPDKEECGDNWPKVNAAFATAVLMLDKIWDDPTRLSLVVHSIRVLISFSSDYSTWKVEMLPYGIFRHGIEEAHPDFGSFIEKEENQILEKYGFAEENKPPRKLEVAYRGRKTIMDEKQYDAFLKDIIKMYPKSWHVMTSIREVKDA